MSGKRRVHAPHRRRCRRRCGLHANQSRGPPCEEYRSGPGQRTPRRASRGRCRTRALGWLGRHGCSLVPIRGRRRSHGREQLAAGHVADQIPGPTLAVTLHRPRQILAVGVARVRPCTRSLGSASISPRLTAVAQLQLRSGRLLMFQRGSPVQFGHSGNVTVVRCTSTVTGEPGCRFSADVRTLFGTDAELGPARAAPQPAAAGPAGPPAAGRPAGELPPERKPGRPDRSQAR